MKWWQAIITCGVASFYCWVGLTDIGRQPGEPWAYVVRIIGVALATAAIWFIAAGLWGRGEREEER